MFTDIVGYSQLMSDDEKNALSILQQNAAIQRTLATEYNGQLLKEIGDGTLLSFDSAYDAVQCAFRIQDQSNQISGLNLRIGIHLGDVIFRDGDVFGEGVNIASRIEQLAEPGGICITEQIFEILGNRTEWLSIPIGSRKLKNISKPVVLYALSKSQGNNAKSLFTKKKQYKSGKSLAVLPFTNMSNDQDQEYFCDGLTEDILNTLTCVEDLHIVSRTISFALKGKTHNLQEIGSKLQVENILDGSVRKAGNRLRISVQLIQVSDGFMIWSDRFDRELKDIFEIQDEIAISICNALQAKLSLREKKVIEKVNTQDIQAYDFYIKGRHYYQKFHKNRLALAIEMFEKAIKVDSQYALAYAGLADCYSFIFLWYQGGESTKEKALSFSAKALELDQDLAEVHISRGLALANTSDYAAAANSFENAIALNPQLFEAYYQYGRTNKEQGLNEQAVELLLKAVELRPDDYEATAILALAYKGLNLELTSKQYMEKSVQLAEKHLELHPEDSRALYLGAIAQASIGAEDKAGKWIEKALYLEPGELGVLYNATCVYSILGKIDRALDLFEQAVAGGMMNLTWIEHDADLDPIRNHPRFMEALKKSSNN